MKKVLRSAGWPVLILLFTLSATAQETRKPEAKTGTTIGVTIVVDRARVQNILPALRERVAGDINRKYRGIHAIALSGPEDVALDEARNKGCAYVLRLKIIDAASVTVGPSGPVGPGIGYPGSHGSEKIVVAYRVIPMDGSDPVVDDDVTIFQEDPGPTVGGMPPRRSTWDMDQGAYQRMVSSGTSAAAQAAIKKFRKQTGL